MRVEKSMVEFVTMTPNKDTPKAKTDAEMDGGGDDDTAEGLGVDTPKAKTDVSVKDLREEEDLADQKQQLIADFKLCDRAHRKARNAVDDKRNAAENAVHKAKIKLAQAQALAEETFAELEAARKRLAEWNENEIMRKTGMSPANFLL